VNAGEVIGLLGPNGASESTSIKLLLSGSLLTSETAEVLGLPLGTGVLREKCGYPPENHRYPGFLTGLESLIFFGRLNGLRQSKLKPKANTPLETVGLTQWAQVKTKGTPKACFNARASRRRSSMILGFFFWTNQPTASIPSFSIHIFFFHSAGLEAREQSLYLLMQ
jgi:ABC-type Na+ transport system ATPase subunit NatA